MLNKAQERVLQIIIDECTVANDVFKGLESQWKIKVLKSIFDDEVFVQVKYYLLQQTQTRPLYYQITVLRRARFHSCPQNAFSHNHCARYTPIGSSATVVEPSGLFNLTRLTSSNNRSCLPTKSEVISFMITQLNNEIRKLTHGDPELESLKHEPYYIAFQMGNKLKAESDFNGSLTYYTKALYYNPKHIDSLNRRGNCYFSLERYDLAIKDYTSVIEIDPYFYKAYFNRGLVHRNMSQLFLALQDYTEAVLLNPIDVDIYNNRGNIFADMGEDEQALNDYNQSVYLYPLFFSAYINRALVYETRSQFVSALQDMNCIAELMQSNDCNEDEKSSTYLSWQSEFREIIHSGCQDNLEYLTH